MRNGWSAKAILFSVIVFLFTGLMPTLGRDGDGAWACKPLSSPLAFSPDGQILAAWDLRPGGEGILFSDAVTGKVLRRLEGNVDVEDYRAAVLAFSPDGRTLAMATEATIHLWDVATETKSREIKMLDGKRATSIAFSPDGRTLAAGGSDDSTIYLLDIAIGKELRKLKVHTKKGGPALTFSPDGKTLALGTSEDATIRLYDVVTGTEFREFKGHDGKGATAIAFSPDSKMLASGSTDSTIRLWSVSTGEELGRLDGPRWRVRAVAFSGDGKTLVAASGSGQEWIKRWKVATDDPLSFVASAGVEC